MQQWKNFVFHRFLMTATRKAMELLPQARGQDAEQLAMIAENIDKTYELRDANGEVIKSF